MEVSFQTGSLLKSCCLSLPLGLQRFFFQKLTCLDFLDMPIFAKSEILLRFGQNIHPDNQRYSQEALRRPSGGPQEAVRSLSETICVSNAFGQSWKTFCGETIMFFCNSGASDLFRRRVAKATCTKYRACAQKLSAVLADGSGIGPRHVLSTPREPL